MSSPHDFFFSTASATLLIKANIYVLFMARLATFMHRLFPFDYTFIIATQDSHSKPAKSAGRKIDHSAE